MKWFAAQCPISDELKSWIEKSSSWLVKLLDVSLDQVTVILPNEEFFPDVYRAREEDVEALLGRVCAYMGVGRERLTLEIFSDEHRELRHLLPIFESRGRGAAGQYENVEEGSITIRLSANNLNDPMSLVATIAHELGHVLLLADAKVARDRKDQEFLTDLVTVLLGLGVFTANSAFKFRQWSGGFKQGWESKRLGYLTEPMFGYALAWFARARQEKNPAWAQYLEGDARHYFKSSMRYLQRSASQEFKAPGML